MNRYKIKNLRNGLEFIVVAPSRPPLIQPEWGKQAGRKLKSEADEWELANGTSAGLDDQGRELWDYPDSRELTFENIDVEIESENTKRIQVSEAAQRIFDFPGGAAATANQRNQFMDDVRRALIFLFKNL